MLTDAIYTRHYELLNDWQGRRTGGKFPRLITPLKKVNIGTAAIALGALQKARDRQVAVADTECCQHQGQLKQ